MQCSALGLVDKARPAGPISGVDVISGHPQCLVFLVLKAADTSRADTQLLGMLLGCPSASPECCIAITGPRASTIHTQST
jgi:hypothetical protein